MVTENSAFSAKFFSCNYCNIQCSKKNDYDRHVLTSKHIGNTIGNKESVNKDFICDFCKKVYKSRKGLWGHNKTCTINQSIIIPENITFRTFAVIIVISCSDTPLIYYSFLGFIYSL